MLNPMKTITIYNSFHGTAANVRLADTNVLSASQVRRVRRSLCGIASCTCGGNLSERGTQDGFDVEPNSDGSVQITFCE